MSLELNLRFPTPEHVIVRLIEDDDHDESEPLPFRGPLAAPDQQDLHWYLEVYAAQYAADVDDDRAQRIAAKLPGWGAALLAAVLGDDVKARRLFDRFLDRREPGRLLTAAGQYADAAYSGDHFRHDRHHRHRPAGDEPIRLYRQR